MDNKQTNVLQYIMDSISESIYWMDMDGKIVGCNKNQLELFGLSEKSQLIGKNIFDVANLLKWPKSIPNKIRQHDLMVISEARKMVTEETVLLNDEEKIFLVQKEPWFDVKSHEIIGIIGIAFDITAYKKAEELQKENIISQKVIHKLKTIASSLAHEIKTPLAGIRTGLSVVNNFMVKAKQNIAEVTEDALAYQEQWILRMIERLDNGHSLINMQLKNMATERINSKIFCAGDLAEWITQAVTTFPFENQALAQKIHLDVPNGITVIGDPLLTQHVLWNLLNNAFHFIKEMDRGEIFITTEVSEKYYILRVKDTAKGMNNKEAAQVFKQFYTNRPDGSGLGLHFCQLIMEAYQGRIECRAEEGQYAEFLLFFPKEFASQPEEPPLAKSESSATA
jgi:PAS domain S-box-containing protein